jgi:UDP:flavonoid glycosyltransferase YjiC (YdhE family)
VEPRLLERSLRALLDDGRYHERAREVGRSLRECPGAEAAVGELERLHAASGAQLQ